MAIFPEFDLDSPATVRKSPGRQHRQEIPKLPDILTRVRKKSKGKQHHRITNEGFFFFFFFFFSKSRKKFLRFRSHGRNFRPRSIKIKPQIRFFGTQLWLFLHPDRHINRLAAITVSVNRLNRVSRRSRASHPHLPYQFGKRSPIRNF